MMRRAFDQKLALLSFVMIAMTLPRDFCGPSAVAPSASPVRDCVARVELLFETRGGVVEKNDRFPNMTSPRARCPFRGVGGGRARAGRSAVIVTGPRMRPWAPAEAGFFAERAAST